MLRVARIPYLNSVPFYQGFPVEGVELLDLPPRELGDAARAGRVDAGILSLCDTFDLDEFEPLLPMGVATAGPAFSVLLFSRRHPADLAGVPIGVTTETATSIRLLELVMREVFGVAEPELRRVQRRTQDDEATLLIGDRALLAAGAEEVFPDRGRYGPGPVHLPGGAGWLLDLGDAWWTWQQKPFVFARWMVRRSVPAGSRAALVEALERSLEASLADLEPLAARHAGRAGLSASASAAYLRNFRYRLGAEEEEGLARFRELIPAGLTTAAGASTRLDR